MPELVRAYGQMLSSEGSRASAIFLGLVLAVTAVVSWFALGALIERISRVFRRPGAPRSSRR